MIGRVVGGRVDVIGRVLGGRFAVIGRVVGCFGRVTLTSEMWALAEFRWCQVLK
jgi:hypothetical protein